MSNSREQFEAWVAGRTVCKKYGAKLHKDSAGSYRDYRINDRWMAWQASREAVVVELPRVHADGYDPLADADYQVCCREAIQSHGLRVRP